MIIVYYFILENMGITIWDSLKVCYYEQLSGWNGQRFSCEEWFLRWISTDGYHIHHCLDNSWDSFENINLFSSITKRCLQCGLKGEPQTTRAHRISLPIYMLS